MISIIVAIADNYAIGKDNQLLWYLPEDLKRFKQITSGHPVIMGKKTYESLPVKPLPKRLNIVLSDCKGDCFPGCKTVNSIEEAMAFCPEDEECFVIGGGTVYRAFLPMADKLYITRVHKSFEADTFFPEILNSDWQLLEQDTAQSTENDFTFSYETYLRRKC